MKKTGFRMYRCVLAEMDKEMKVVTFLKSLVD